MSAVERKCLFAVCLSSNVCVYVFGAESEGLRFTSAVTQCPKLLRSDEEQRVSDRGEKRWRKGKTEVDRLTVLPDDKSGRTNWQTTCCPGEN